MNMNNTPITTDERVFYSNTFNLKAKLEPADAILFNKVAAVELLCFNQLVQVFGSQFNRDYTFFSGIEPATITMFSEMCNSFVDIYNVRRTDTSEFLTKHKEILDNMPSSMKFILTEASKLGPILPEVKRRMGASILSFYVQQTSTRMNNKKMVKSEDGDIQFTAPVDCLTTLTSFNKNHLQIPKNFCSVNKTEHGTFITVPYLKKPIQVFPKDKSLFVSNWNYLILRQKDKSAAFQNHWTIDFKKIKPNQYLYKYVDRLGKSGVFEMGKRMY